MEDKRARDNAIEIKDVCIYYKLLDHITVRNSLWRKREQEKIFEAVKNVSFSVREGAILGMIGRNGCGKSTLLRAIGGIFSPNSGTIDLKGHSVSLMSLGIGFKPELSGRENIILSGMLLGFKEKEILEKMDSIVNFAGLGDFINRPIRTYSSGMHSKLAFSITAMLETDIMLIDEVLSVGDEKFKKKSLAKMEELISNKNRTVIIVSHNLSMLEEMCDEILWLHDGEVKEMGIPEDVIEHYLEFMEAG